MKHHQTASQPAPEGVAKAKLARSSRKGKVAGDSGKGISGNGHEELVRQRAYFLYEARHCEGDHELDDWLQAEAQVSQEISLQRT